MPVLLLVLSAAPEANELFNSAIAARKAQAEKKFTFREDIEQVRQSGSTIETFDVIMLEGENYRKLILIDGKPLDAKRQKQVNEDMEKTRAARQRPSFRSIRRTVKIGDLADIQRLFDCKVAGEEVVGGRKTWRVEAEPKSGIKPANKQDQNFLATRRTLWFDQEEGINIKMLTLYIRDANGFQPGSELEVAFTKVNSTWLPETYHFRFHLKALVVVSARGEVHHRFYDCKLFQTESNLIPQ